MAWFELVCGEIEDSFPADRGLTT